MFDNTKKYADYICRGDGVPFLRKLFGEDVNALYKLELMSSKMTTKVFGLSTKSDTAHLVTKLGCPMKCDFCITYQLYQGNYTPTFFTPEEVHDAIIAYKHKLKRNFDILVCEPTAIINKKWWYNLFQLFEGDPDEYTISFATTVASLKKLDYERITRSSLRIKYVNIGVESFSLDYAKNQKHRDTKILIKKLTDYGILSWATFIIGFDHQTRDIVWDEVHKLMDLDTTFNAVLNLKVLPGTPLWNKYKAEGRLLEVSNDFYYMDGFQSFIHPHFKPGFEDMLPLLYDINKYIESETGFRGLKLVELYKNIPIQRESYQKDIETQKILAKLLFPSWKEHLKPNERQIKNYLQKMGEVPEIPDFLRVAAENYAYSKNN